MYDVFLMSNFVFRREVLKLFIIIFNLCTGIVVGINTFKGTIAYIIFHCLFGCGYGLGKISKLRV